MNKRLVRLMKRDRLVAGPFSKAVLVAFLLLFGGVGLYFVITGHAAVPNPDPLISNGIPVYTNGSNYSGGTANAINDNDYGSQLCSPTSPVTPSTPFYAAYDLTNVPASHRTTVIVAMFSNTYAFDLSYFNDMAYSVPADWTIDVNNAPSGTYPTSGWVTLATISNNTWGTRQSVVNMTGYNWIRINVTGNLGSGGNNGACINQLDVHDASAGVSDDFMLFGDSITANTMDPDSTTTTAQYINQANAAYFPLIEPGGIPFLQSSDGVNHLATWLQNFPGLYVGLSYGTNDAAGNVDPQTFYNNYASMVQTVLAANKIPIVPTVIWRCSPYDVTIQQYNQEIQTLYANFPQVIHGPDLYAFFAANQSYISSNDCIHPNGPGDDQYRQLWANAILANVYNAPVDTTPPSVPTNLHSTGATSSSINLAWTASTDPDSIVSGYKLYRGGSLVTTVTSGTTYTDTGLTASTSYAYTVSAIDPTGNESAQSTTVNVSTLSGSTGVPGDCNGDGHVTIIDLSILLTHYNTNYLACDFNNDGIVNIFDLSILLSHYGT